MWVVHKAIQHEMIWERELGLQDERIGSVSVR